MIPQRNVRRRPRQSFNLGTKPISKPGEEAIKNSRFAALSNLAKNDPQTVDHVDQVKPLEMAVISQPPKIVTNQQVEEQVAAHQNTVKTKATSSSKRSGTKKASKTPYEKANDHVVVTSQPGGVKRMNNVSHQKSPFNVPKIPQKSIRVSDDSSKSKLLKMPNFDETLELVRIQGKAMGNSDDTLNTEVWLKNSGSVSSLLGYLYDPLPLSMKGHRISNTFRLSVVVSKPEASKMGSYIMDLGNDRVQGVKLRTTKTHQLNKGYGISLYYHTIEPSIFSNLEPR
ncbi:uncharacterized protein G2W53_027504 [Senna tora]|uniref:Uncharacterized protein n=1 Tax=Senna tora TaxID=362788 RepID=A0A834WMA5_9FABA|nr:uncharacterized protein G2W53_027504 [Senna tora]